MRHTLASSCVAALVFLAIAAEGHHSAAPLFDTGAAVAVEGIVTEVWFENPHSRYYVEVRSESGETALWEAETMNANWFLRRGWDEITVRVGDQVNLSGYPARDGARVILLRILAREGEELYRWTRIDATDLESALPDRPCVILSEGC